MITNKIKVKKRALKVLQFGEGNFLRAFVDYMIDVANEKKLFDGSVAIIKPIRSGNLETFKSQKNLYTVSLRGRHKTKIYNENRIITCIDEVLDVYEEFDKFLELAKTESLEFIVSNTTEAGIEFSAKDKLSDTPPESFPAKLTVFLYERYKFFSGDKDKGFYILPVELIENNGEQLKKCVLEYIELWDLEEEFKNWVLECNTFCNTLVDRIVTGYPVDEVLDIFSKLGYTDKLLVTAEQFGLWVIEDKNNIAEKLPLDKANLNVIFAKDITPYRDRKVRILNGAHTAVSLAAFLAGKDIILDCMYDSIVRKYIHELIFTELAPFVKLPHKEVKEYAKSVLERFENTHIKHNLLNISLNSVSKFKTRLLPSIKDYYNKYKKAPKLLSFSFASLICFYRPNKYVNGILIGERNGIEYVIKDDQKVLDYFYKNKDRIFEKDFVFELASNVDFWGEDLNPLGDFTETAAKYLEDIKNNGIYEVMIKLTQKEV